MNQFETLMTERMHGQRLGVDARFLHPNPGAPAMIREAYYNLGWLLHLRMVVSGQRHEVPETLASKIDTWHTVLKVVHEGLTEFHDLPPVRLVKRIPDWAEGAVWATPDGEYALHRVFLDEVDRWYWDVCTRYASELVGHDVVAVTLPTLSSARMWIRYNDAPKQGPHRMVIEHFHR